MNKHNLTIQPITKRNILIFVTTIALYSGFFLGHRPVFIFGEFLLLVLVGSFIYSSLLLRRVRIKREHYPRTFEGSDVFITLYFQTDDKLPHYLLEAVDTTPPATRYFIGNMIPGAFSHKDDYVIEYRLHCSRRRGVYTLGPITLSCADPLGLFLRHKEFPLFSKLLVYPRAVPLQAFKLMGDGTLRQVGIETILTSGHSEEFIGVREYVRGDPPGTLHWKLSAHHRKLIVKEFKENTITEVSIFMDMFRLSMCGLGDMTTIEYIVKACAAISRLAIEKSHLVQVLAFCNKTVHIPPGGGMPHLLTILDQLTFIQAGGEGSFTQEVKKHIHKVRRGSTAILLACASSILPEEILPILRQFAVRNVRTILVLIDDKTFIKLWQEQEQRHLLTPPAGELVSLLRQEGCDVYLIACREKLEQKLITPSGLN